MKYLLIIVSCLLLLSACLTSKKRINSKVEKHSVKLSVGDTSKKIAEVSKKEASPKAYHEVITTKVKTDSGLFKIHFLGGKYFFEIPDSLLNRDILVVNRISKSAADIRPNNGAAGFAGDDIGNNVFRFEKGPNHKLFMKTVSFQERANDSTENGMYRNLINSSLQPIVASFEIKTYRPDSSGVVIDLTDYVNGDNLGFSFSTSAKQVYTLAGIQSDKSYIKKISSFPLNVEIQCLKTFANSKGGTATFELNTSIVLLPCNPMKERPYDARVGYFSDSYRDFDAPQELKWRPIITRWRLEPRPEDVERYLKGELVEPKKPIVFYIDPATPKKWVPYLIQGVNDWQKAFEKAGFRNAIYALKAPVNNPEWSLYDARHSAIIYKPSAMSNASGPHIHDPRTGEILESHVNWYHNVMELLRNWYMVQAGVNDKRAQKLEFDEELMGQLIRFVSSHEIGHTLGLMHNFGASSTIPVEKLRDKKWVEENGFCPSIMDYARFNYVAQPEDKISEKGIFPRIGMYDEWAIEWGYRWFPHFSSLKEEKSYLNMWVTEQLKKDKRFWYGEQPFGGLAPIYDPRSQSEDLGDDAMKASSYGMLNLKKTMLKLKDWTLEPHADYSALAKMRTEVVTQYQRYLSHVLNNIGLYLWTERMADDKGDKVSFASKEKTKSAVAFLNRELFDTPDWILNREISAKVGMDGKFQPLALQSPVLTKLISLQSYANLSVWPTYYPAANVYSFKDLMQDLEKGIWKELNQHQHISLHRRSLQRAYADRLISSLSAKANSDFQVIIKEEMKELLGKINRVLKMYQDKVSKLHLADIKERLTIALDPRIPAPVVAPAAPEKTAFWEQTWNAGCWGQTLNF